jgi:hypothetical protein
MTPTTTHGARIAEAAEWRLIGLLFERPRSGWHEEAAALVREVPDAALRDAAAVARNATEGEYLRLLGPGGVVSPREVTYQPFADPGHLLAELAMAYDAFAFQPRVEDPIDHIAVEVAFVGYLLLKEAFAEARGDGNAAAIAAAARRAFAEEHLAALAAPFAQRLQAAGPSYLLSCARLLAERMPVRPPAPSLPSPPDVPDVCSACAPRLTD